MEAGHHPPQRQACRHLQGWGCSAVVPAMAVTWKLCDDGEKFLWNSQTPSLYEAKPFFLMNFM